MKCVTLDMGRDAFDVLPDDFTYVLNFAVVHSWTPDFDHDLAVNVEGAGILMAHCNKAKAFLQCSSTAVYEAVANDGFKETDPLGDNHRGMLPTYSISKIASESMARFGARHWNMPTVIARLNVPYGANGGWPAMHLEMMRAGQDIAVGPGSSHVYNPIHEDDVVAQVPRLLDIADVPAVTVNWGGSDQASIEEWCGYLGELTGLAYNIVCDEKHVAKCRDRYNKDAHADRQDLGEVEGWVPQNGRGEASRASFRTGTRRDPMRKHRLAVVTILCALAVCVSSAYAQTPYDPPRLPDGNPDLQGVWDFRTLTPLERPEELADKAILGAEEGRRDRVGGRGTQRRAQRPNDGAR